MTSEKGPSRLVPLLLLAILPACGAPPDAEPAGEVTSAPAVAGVADRVLVIEGFSEPEAVRYDPDQDVFFVSNFAGDGGDRDANGFISRVSGEGRIEGLRFATGTDDAPLHAPRGMFITGDTLWAADVDGVHGFHRRTGAALVFIDFSPLEPGFLNDIAAGPDGVLHVTDTGASRLYRIVNGAVEIAVQGDEVGTPNGIAWQAAEGRFVLAPWGGSQQFRAWSADGGLVELLQSEGGFFDGIEVVDGALVVASQADSTIRWIDGAGSRPFVRTPGRAADIAVDTRRRRVAVPYIALDRVDVWALPVP